MHPERLTNEPPDNFLNMLETNRMELEIIERSGLEKEAWIEKYGARFRQIIKEIIENRPLYDQLLKIFKENPGTVEKYIEDELVKLDFKQAA